jgi:hypothetical protein
MLRTTNLYPGIFNKRLIDHLFLSMFIKKSYQELFDSPWLNELHHERYRLSVNVYHKIPIKNYLICLGCTGCNGKSWTGVRVRIICFKIGNFEIKFLNIDFKWLLIEWHIVGLGIVVVCDQAIVGCKDIFNGQQGLI